MWLIKGRRISFEMDDGTTLELPVSHGMMHNPNKQSRCRVYFGPFERSGESITKVDRFTTNYFGSDYKARAGYIDFPEGKWTHVGAVARIYYERPGEFSDYYQHPFKEPVPLSRNGSFYRLELPKGCVVNDRGFVSP